MSSSRPPQGTRASIGFGIPACPACGDTTTTPNVHKVQDEWLADCAACGHALVRFSASNTGGLQLRVSVRRLESADAKAENQNNRSAVAWRAPKGRRSKGGGRSDEPAQKTRASPGTYAPECTFTIMPFLPTSGARIAFKAYACPTCRTATPSDTCKVPDGMVVSCAACGDTIVLFWAHMTREAESPAPRPDPVGPRPSQKIDIWSKDIPNTFAPNCTTKMLTPDNVVTLVKFGLVRWEDIPDDVKKRASAFVRARWTPAG